jgi:hypothetical protein
MADSPEILSLKVGQISNILEQYRANIYNLELRQQLLMKILEEKGIFISGEFDQRWPTYLKNNVGVLGPDGIMEGSLKIRIYGEPNA